MDKEKDKFLDEITPKEEEDAFSHLNPEKKEEVAEPISEEPDEVQLRNRRERRLHEKYQAERESSIRLSAKLEALTEAQKLRAEAGDDYLKPVEKIYGTDTPEAMTATELLKSALKGVGERATERALEQFREEQRQAREQEKRESESLDRMVDELEDEHNLVISEPQRKGFFALLEKMSPKDQDGNVTAYADHHAVWEIYQSKTQRTDTRAKDLSSRSMVSSGASQSSKLESDATERFLKENDII